MADTQPLKPRYYRNLPEMTRTWDADPESLPYEEKLALFDSLKKDRNTNPPNHSLISNSNGRLEEVLFTIPGFLNAEPLYGDIYRKLFSTLPEYTKITIAAHPSAIPTFESHLPNRARIIPVPAHLDFTPWVQDPFISASIQDQSILLEPILFGRKQDQLISSFLKQDKVAERLRMPAYFEGGNILCGDDYYLVGADYLVKTHILYNQLNLPGPGRMARSFFKNLDETRECFFVGSELLIPPQEKREFSLNNKLWKEVVFPKNQKGTSQPLFHLDMFISPAGNTPDGKAILLVGDPMLAATILEQEPAAEMMGEFFDDIAESLACHGFHIIRNPLPLVYIDNEEDRIRHWYFASANNAIIEITKESKKVWMPTYGHAVWEELKKTDQANRETWEKAGFEVILLPDCNPLAENNGSVHCITKYLRRGS